MLVGAVDPMQVVILFLIALFVGAINSLLALLLDERYGYFNDPRQTLQLLTICFIENLGLRQVTVWWRIRAMYRGRHGKVWGNMERRGVAKVSRAS
jgi:hypothetical protein